MTALSLPAKPAMAGSIPKPDTLIFAKENTQKIKKTIERGCGCLACSGKISRLKIRGLIKSKNRKQNTAGQRWCLMHNMWFFNNLLEEIRKSIKRNKFTEFKKKFLKKFLNPS